jgi:hypothetical protein
MHSTYYNKCFGSNNIRSYVLFLILTQALTIMFAVTLGKHAWKELDFRSSNVFYQVIEVHLYTGWVDIVALICAELYALKVLDNLMHALSAISRNMTINELNNCWNYKYLYMTRRGRSKYSTANHYYH